MIIFKRKSAVANFVHLQLENELPLKENHNYLLKAAFICSIASTRSKLPKLVDT